MRWPWSARVTANHTAVVLSATPTLLTAALCTFVFAVYGPAIDRALVFLPFLVLVLAVAAWRWARHRAELLALAAAAAASLVGTFGTLIPAVAGLVFLSVATDPRRLPWVGWAGGLAGSVLSSILLGAFSFQAAAPLPYFLTLAGGGSALLVDYWERNRTLTGETRQLRGHTVWLEQRTAVARELHDVVGHQVTAIVVQAEAGRVGDLADAHEMLRRIGDLGRTALTELDQLVVNLRDPGHDLAVTAPPRLLDIDELLAQPLRQTGARVDVRVGTELGLDEAAMLAVYRIAQEALTNVARHAHARHVWVELDRREDRVRLRVSDDGVGPADELGRGSGLIGMHERVAAYGRTIELVTRPGGGAILDVLIPMATGARTRSWVPAR